MYCNIQKITDYSCRGYFFSGFVSYFKNHGFNSFFLRSFQYFTMKILTFNTIDIMHINKPSDILDLGINIY